MHYYGTNLTESGHYFWKLDEARLIYKGIDNRGEAIPFNPEQFFGSDAPKGTCGYFHIEGYSIIAICGSCKDTRGGTKSVFWVKGKVSPDELKEMILAVPIAQSIIEQMPFEVQW